MKHKVSLVLIAKIGVYLVVVGVVDLNKAVGAAHSQMSAFTAETDDLDF